MATRPRPSTPVQYEDFLPKYQWKEETGSHVLSVYLPQEFKKEQIRITYVQSTRMIRVNGERPILNNRWSRFSQGFPVPQNCDVNKIEARYQNGVLTLTMPKTSPPAAPLPAVAPKEQPKPPQQVAPPPPPPPKEVPAPATAPKKLEEKTETATVAVTAQTPQKPRPPPPQKPIPPKSHDETTEKMVPPKDAVKGKGETSLPAEDESGKKRKEKVGEDESSGDKESSKKRKESMADVKSEGRKKESDEDKAIEEFIVEKVKKVRDLARAAKRNIQDFSMEVNEDRQAMVNIGVAVLVIVALGTYIYYSRGSSRTTK